MSPSAVASSGAVRPAPRIPRAEPPQAEPFKPAEPARAKEAVEPAMTRHAATQRKEAPTDAARPARSGQAEAEAKREAARPAQGGEGAPAETPGQDVLAARMASEVTAKAETAESAETADATGEDETAPETETMTAGEAAQPVAAIIGVANPLVEGIKLSFPAATAGAAGDQAPAAAAGVAGESARPGTPPGTGAPVAANDSRPEPVVAEKPEKETPAQAKTETREDAGFRELAARFMAAEAPVAHTRHASTEAPAANAPQESATPASRPTPVAAVPIEIGLRAMEGTKRFDIRLDPPELGRVEVRLEFTDDGQVSATLTVDRVDTAALLQRDARTLERAFDQAGFRTADGGVDIRLSDHARRDGQGGSSQPWGAAGREAARQAGSDAPEDALSHPVRRSLRLGGVDLSV